MAGATPARKMTLWNMIAYGCVDIYGGGAFFLIGSLYLVFLTMVVGLSPVYAGTIILLGKFWAAVANAASGYISDHTRSRFGRRRVYFLLGMVPVFGLLWMPVTLAADCWTFLYHLLIYLLYNSVFALTKVPYNSILAEMTSDYQVRSKAMGVRMVFSQGGMFASAFVPLTIITHAATPKTGYIIFGCVFGILFSLPWLIAFLGTWDHGTDAPVGCGLRANIRQMIQDFKSTAYNRTFVIHMAMYLLTFLNMDVFNGVVLFFASSSLGLSSDKARNLITVVQGSQMLAIPVVTWAVCRFGNVRAFRVSLVLWGAGILSLASVPVGASFGWPMTCALLTGLGLSGAMMIPWNIQSFVADVDELITAERREGIYAGVMQFVRQISIGVGLFATNVALEMFGFNKGAAVQTPAFGDALRIFLVVTALCLLSLAIVISQRFLLDASAHRLLLGEIVRLRAGGKKWDVDPAVSSLCERLTGMDYQRLWR